MSLKLKLDFTRTKPSKLSFMMANRLIWSIATKAGELTEYIISMALNIIKVIILDSPDPAMERTEALSILSRYSKRTKEHFPLASYRSWWWLHNIPKLQCPNTLTVKTRQFLTVTILRTWVWGSNANTRDKSNATIITANR